MYGVRSVKVAECEVPAPRVFWMDRWLESVPLCFQIVAVQGEAVTALVNTGPPQDLAAINALWGQEPDSPGALRRRPGEELPAALHAAGIDPDQVTHLLLTPLQLYTTGNIPLFPNAEICMSRRGWAQFHTLHEHFHDTRENTFSPEVLTHLTTDARHRVRLLDDHERIAPGIRTRWCGGHHRASMEIIVTSTDGTVVISDAFFYYENVEGGPLLGSSENLYESRETAEHVRTIADHVVPLYDPKVFDRYTDGVVAPLPAVVR